jgi:glycosyltransferase involved in cell wall biosynthesis
MKISIITISKNSESTIERTICSVINQDYKDLEYIIIDGGSADLTVSIINKYKEKVNHIISESDKGIYDAINKGISLSTGELVCILHSNDIFFNNQTLSKVYKYFYNDQNLNILLGAVSYKKDFNKKSTSRYYSARFFRPWMLRFGISPPHPSSFIKRKVYDRYGFYNDTYQIAGDFDIFTRYLLKNNLPYKISQECFVVMQPGGLSNKNIKSFYISTIEILKSLKINNIYSNFFFVLLRFPIKIIQFII